VPPEPDVVVVGVPAVGPVAEFATSVVVEVPGADEVTGPVVAVPGAGKTAVAVHDGPLDTGVVQGPSTSEVVELVELMFEDRV
jgi:hypothetical protein